MPSDPGQRHIGSLLKLIAQNNKAEAIAKTASQTFEFEKLQALLDAKTEIEDAQAAEEAQQAAAQAAEAAKQAALGPFQMDLPADGALAERPVAFRNPLSQLSVNGMAQAAKTGLSMQQALQQRVNDAGVTPPGVQAFTQGLPQAGPVQRTVNTQTSLSAQPLSNGGRGGFTLVPSQTQQVTEQPNALTAGDLLQARIAEAQLRQRQVEFGQTQEQQRALALAKEQGGLVKSILEDQLQTNREKGLAELRQKLDIERDAAKLNLAASLRRLQEGIQLTPGEKKADEEAVKGLVAFRSTGGFATVEKDLDSLTQVAQRLENGEQLTGAVIGLIPDALLGFVNPESIDVRDRVGEVIQKNLRAILGGQFAQKEGEALVKRSFNPDLPETVNAKRLRAEISRIREMGVEKQREQDYFEANGTLKGFQRRSFNLNVAPEKDPSSAQYRPTPEQARAELERRRRANP